MHGPCHVDISIPNATRRPPDAGECAGRSQQPFLGVKSHPGIPGAIGLAMIERRNRRTNQLRRRSGQALVEFALVLPIFLLLLFGTIDFGRYVYYVQILNNAAREGARYAIVHGGNSFQPTGPNANDPTIATVVRTYAVGVIGNGATFDVASTWGTPPNPPTNNRGSNGPRGRDLRLPFAHSDRAASSGHHQRGVDTCRQQLTPAASILAVVTEDRSSSSSRAHSSSFWRSRPSYSMSGQNLLDRRAEQDVSDAAALAGARYVHTANYVYHGGCATAPSGMPAVNAACQLASDSGYVDGTRRTNRARRSPAGRAFDVWWSPGLCTGSDRKYSSIVLSGDPRGHRSEDSRGWGCDQSERHRTPILLARIGPSWLWYEQDQRRAGDHRDNGRNGPCRLGLSNRCGPPQRKRRPNGPRVRRRRHHPDLWWGTEQLHGGANRGPRFRRPASEPPASREATLPCGGPTVGRRAHSGSCPGGSGPATEALPSVRFTTGPVTGKSYRNLPGLLPGGISISKSTVYMDPGIYWIGGGGVSVQSSGGLLISKAAGDNSGTNPTGGVLIYDTIDPVPATGCTGAGCFGPISINGSPGETLALRPMLQTGFYKGMVMWVDRAVPAGSLAIVLNGGNSNSQYRWHDLRPERVGPGIVASGLADEQAAAALDGHPTAANPVDPWIHVDRGLADSESPRVVARENSIALAGHGSSREPQRRERLGRGAAATRTAADRPAVQRLDRRRVRWLRGGREVPKRVA